MDLRWIILIALLSGCQHLPGSFCLTYDPVSFSKRDTKKTVDQIQKNNAVYEKC